MRWSKLQKQLYLIMDKKSKFQMHCSVYKTKSAWNAGQRHGISNKQESGARFWITVGDNKEIIWDFPNNFLDSDCQYVYRDNQYLPIRICYFVPDNFMWVSECLKFYLDTPRDKLLTQKHKDDKYGLTEILRKYDRRISKKIREEL